MKRIYLWLYIICMVVAAMGFLNSPLQWETTPALVSLSLAIAFAVFSTKAEMQEEIDKLKAEVEKLTPPLPLEPME